MGQLVGQQGRQFIGAFQILQHGVGDVDVAVRAGLAAEYGVGKQVGLARQPADSGGLLEPLQLLVDVALGFRVADQTQAHTLVAIAIGFRPDREHADAIVFIDLGEHGLIRSQLPGDEASDRLGRAAYAARQQNGGGTESR